LVWHSAGDVAVLPSDNYYTARVLAQGYFTQMGVHVHLAPTAGNAQQQYLHGARLLWLESPSNPGLEVCDIATLVSAAHDAGALVAVDNTTPTVLGQCPLALGADFSVASDTKALTGHADLILGHVAARDQAWAERLHAWRTQIGAVPGPMEVWLAHRSLATLDLRLERQCHTLQHSSASMRPDVSGVRIRCPTDTPRHCHRQMQLWTSSLHSADMRAETFLAACQLVT
jgi:cystathionine gamma-lyase